MASLFGRIVRGASRVAGRVAAPVARTVGKGLLRQIPGIGLGIAAVEGFQAVRSALSPGQPAGLPALPALPGGAMMATAGGGGGAMEAFAVQSAATGRRGSVAMPPLTIEMIRQLEAAGLMTGFSQLRTFRRSPRKDQVVVHPMDPATGSVATFALNKKLARTWGLWKPASKPPISAGEMNAIRKANSVVKKLRNLNSEVKKVANFGQRIGPPRLRVVEAPGRKFVARKAA